MIPSSPALLLNPITVILPPADWMPLVLGNLLAAMVEYLVLGSLFGLRDKRGLLLVYLANICSAMTAGYPIKAWLPWAVEHLHLDPFLTPLALMLGVGVLSVLGALLVEAPAYAVLLRLLPRRPQSLWRPLLLAHLASWPASLGLAFLVTHQDWDLSLLTRTRRVQVAELAPPRTWIFLERDGRIFKQRLGDPGQVDLQLPADAAHTVSLEPKQGGWFMEFWSPDPQTGDFKHWGKVLAPATWRGPSHEFSEFRGLQATPWRDRFLGISVLQDETFFTAVGGALRRIQPQVQDRGGLLLARPGRDPEPLRCFMPLHRSEGSSVLTLPEGRALIQLDDWIVIMDPDDLRYAPVARGRLRLALVEPQG